MKVLSLEYLEFSFILRPVSKWKKTFNIGTHKFNRIKTIAGCKTPKMDILPSSIIGLVRPSTEYFFYYLEIKGQSRETYSGLKQLANTYIILS